MHPMVLLQNKTTQSIKTIKLLRFWQSVFNSPRFGNNVIIEPAVMNGLVFLSYKYFLTSYNNMKADIFW